MSLFKPHHTHLPATMAVLPLPSTEPTLGDIAQLKAAVAPLHPYLLPSTLHLSSMAEGLFSNSEVLAPTSSMVLSPSSISSLLSSVKEHRGKGDQEGEDLLMEEEGYLIEDEKDIQR